MESQLTNFIEERGILSVNRFGFRKKLGTTGALMLIQHEYVSQIDKGGVSRVLAVDIAGAFDRVLHAGLLHKLRIQRVDGIYWSGSEVIWRTGKWQQLSGGGAPPRSSSS